VFFVEVIVDIIIISVYLVNNNGTRKSVASRTAGEHVFHAIPMRIRLRAEEVLRLVEALLQV
jgi:hypothetical protein